MQLNYFCEIFYDQRHVENITCFDDVVYDVMTSTISVVCNITQTFILSPLE